MSGPPGRVLALDYGRSRIGAAICDPLGITASPLPVIGGKDPAKAVREIAALCEREEVERLLVGLPLSLDGSEGLATQELRRFTERVRKALPDVPIEEVDERLSSKLAHALLKDAGVNHRTRKAHVDSTAAVLILRSWLGTRRLGGS